MDPTTWHASVQKLHPSVWGSCAGPLRLLTGKSKNGTMVTRSLRPRLRSHGVRGGPKKYTVPQNMALGILQ